MKKFNFAALQSFINRREKNIKYILGNFEIFINLVLS